MCVTIEEKDLVYLAGESEKKRVQGCPKLNVVET